MGGRGQNYKIVNRLTNYKKAVIPSDKLGNYLLNPTKDEDKAKFFASLGYNMSNAKRLEDDIRDKLSTNKALEYVEKSKNGDTEYQVNMELGISKKAIVSTGWTVSKGSTIPRFVTAYQNKKLNKKG